MTAKPKAPAEPNKSASQIVDSGSAPFIYFDEAPNFGCDNAIVRFTLAAYREVANTEGGVTSTLAIVGHFRCGVQAAISLRDTLDKALLVEAPAPQQIN